MPIEWRRDRALTDERYQAAAGEGDAHEGRGDVIKEEIKGERVSRLKRLSTCGLCICLLIKCVFALRK